MMHTQSHTQSSPSPTRTKTDGSALSWDDICVEQLPRIYNFLRYQVGSRALAEDLTSTTFEKAWRNRSQFRGNEATAASWLFTIARNTARDHFRTSKHEVTLDEVDDLPSPDTVEEAAQSNKRFAQLYALLSQLPDRERELIALKYGAEMNNRQIAAQAGLTESNVGTILHRIISKLKSQWED